MTPCRGERVGRRDREAINDRTSKMQKTDLTKEQYDGLVAAIFSIIIRKGPKATTMDYVAQRLGMSKRTLYEIFGSKDEMLAEVLVSHRAMYGAKIKEIVGRTANMMEAIANVFLFHIEFISEVNPKFFFDMDVRYHALRDKYESSAHFSKYMLEACQEGVRQGVFRTDVNYPVTIDMVRVQMESLKRMEEFFPAGISLGEALGTIGIGFLRSIASHKGMDQLDKMSHRFITPRTPSEILDKTQRERTDSSLRNAGTSDSATD